MLITWRRHCIYKGNGFLSSGVDQTLATLVVGVIIGAIVIAALYWFFGTEIGCALRATGNNEFMVRALGGNRDTSEVLGLVIF